SLSLPLLFRLLSSLLGLLPLGSLLSLLLFGLLLLLCLQVLLLLSLKLTHLVFRRFVALRGLRSERIDARLSLDHRLLVRRLLVRRLLVPLIRRGIVWRRDWHGRNPVRPHRDHRLAGIVHLQLFFDRLFRQRLNLECLSDVWRRRRHDRLLSDH